MFRATDTFHLSGHLLFDLPKNLVFNGTADFAAGNIVTIDFKVEFYRSCRCKRSEGTAFQRNDSIVVAGGAGLIVPRKTEDTLGDLSCAVREFKESSRLHLFPVAIEDQPVSASFNGPTVVRNRDQKVAQTRDEEV